MFNIKKMDLWTAVRTVLQENPGLKAEFLIPKLRRATGLSRSTIYPHLDSWVENDRIYREKARYWLEKPEQGYDLDPAERMWMSLVDFMDPNHSHTHAWKRLREKYKSLSRTGRVNLLLSYRNKSPGNRKSSLLRLYTFLARSRSRISFLFRLLIRRILLRLRHTKTLPLLAGFEYVTEMDGARIFRKRK